MYVLVAVSRLGTTSISAPLKAISIRYELPAGSFCTTTSQTPPTIRPGLHPPFRGRGAMPWPYRSKVAHPGDVESQIRRRDARLGSVGLSGARVPHLRAQEIVVHLSSRARCDKLPSHCLAPRLTQTNIRTYTYTYKQKTRHSVEGVYLRVEDHAAAASPEALSDPGQPERGQHLRAQIPRGRFHENVQLLVSAKLARDGGHTLYGVGGSLDKLQHRRCNVGIYDTHPRRSVLHTTFRPCVTCNQTVGNVLETVATRRPRPFSDGMRMELERPYTGE